MLFFPPFAKSRTDRRKRKFCPSLEKKYEEKLAHAFLHLWDITLFFIIPTTTTTFRTSHTKTHKNTDTVVVV